MHIQNGFLVILFTILAISGFAQDSVDIESNILDTAVVDTTSTYTGTANIASVDTTKIDTSAINQAVIDRTVIDTSLYISGDNDHNLLIATDLGYADEVLRLLNKGADINASTWEGITPLMYAVQNQDTGMVRILVLNDADTDKKPVNGIPALINAVITNNMQIAEYLIRKGADINISDNSGNTPLMYGAAYGYFDMSDMLIYYEADLNKKNNSGTDALMIAAYYGDYDIAYRLVEEGANINSKDYKGYSAILCASQNGHSEVIELLIDNGANINTKTYNGYSPVAVAVEYQDLELLKFLVDKGADVNERISFSENPVSLASEYKDKSMKKFLLENKGRRNLWPAFNQYALDFNLSWNFDDFMTGMKFGLHDKKYNVAVNTGFSIRPWAIRVLEKESGELSYQYWERRISLILGMDKRFNIINPGGKSVFGILLGMNEMYTFGSYRGSLSNPEDKLIFVPRSGIFWSSDHFEIDFNYEYLDYGLYKVNPNRFNISFIFKINRKKNNYFPKDIGEF
ncbi:MAG: ankyrin repeat domain-containing protein [Bacteroidales bacterium]|nr:MAG: ankyrin repeat domain-containing protein [Bacteroidales bacterium]